MSARAALGLLRLQRPGYRSRSRRCSRLLVGVSESVGPSIHAQTLFGCLPCFFAVNPTLPSRVASPLRNFADCIAFALACCVAWRKTSKMWIAESRKAPASLFLHHACAFASTSIQNWFPPLPSVSKAFGDIFSHS